MYSILTVTGWMPMNGVTLSGIPRLFRIQKVCSRDTMTGDFGSASGSIPISDRNAVLFKEGMGRDTGKEKRRQPGRRWWQPGMGLVDFTNPEAADLVSGK